MEFYQVINNRRTVRSFKSQPVDVEVVKRILAAGLKAPTNDHMRNWEFFVLTDKSIIDMLLKKIPKKVSDKRVEYILKSWRFTDVCQRNMYIDAIPKQFGMLSESGCLVLPFFKQTKNLLEPKDLSALNAFASIWCCIENIVLASTAEGLGCAIRIPLGHEAEHISVVLSHPKEYMLPCYLAIGYPREGTALPEQIDCDLENKIHINSWHQASV